MGQLLEREFFSQQTLFTGALSKIMKQLVPVECYNKHRLPSFPYLLCAFPFVLSRLVEVLDDVFEGVDLDSAAPPFFSP